MRRLGPATGLVLSAVLGLGAGGAAHWKAPHPVASVAAGTDEAFGVGPYRRRVTSTGVQRWTGARDVFRFARLPGSPTELHLTARHHAAPVDVVVRGARLGSLPPGVADLTVPLPPGLGPDLTVELRTEVRAGGSPGALVERLTVRTDRRAGTGLAALLLFALPALAAAAGAGRVGFTPLATFVHAAATCLLAALAFVPHGLLRSGWAITAASVFTAGVLAASALAHWIDQRRPGSGRWAYAAGLVVLLGQGLAATTPLMPVSDALFHAHKLQEVAAGNLFPVSLTQHATPFRFPYGVAFYALLAPLLHLGLDPLALVRWGAAVAGMLAAVAVFSVVLPRGAAHAALATIALQLLPITFDVLSYGNLSNAFGQSMTVVFFAWWAGAGLGGWAVGALLVALAALAHFSSFVVVGVLAVALAVTRRRDGTLDRPRVIAAAVGLGLAAAYYLSFLPLVLEQLPRLKEGGGSGKVQRGVMGEAWDELLWLRLRWGLPAIALLALGRPRPSRGSLDRDTVAFWISGALLAALALFTPVEVRYVYALTLPLAIAMADALVDGASDGPSAKRALVVALGVAQAAVAVSAMAEAITERYR
jgi:hypothetical protein